MSNLTQSVIQRKSLGKSAYQGTVPTLNSIPQNENYSQNRFEYFRDALTVCFVCRLLPEQAVKEFQDEYGTAPPPRYFGMWRQCWDEFSITPEMVTEWLEAVDRSGWVGRLGGVK